MTIKKRLLLSNMAMIILPVLSFFAIEVILGYFMFIVDNGIADEKQLNLFLSLRLVGLLIVLVVTNGLLTYFVARSIIKPIQQLSKATEEISKGNLDFSIVTNRSDEISQLAETFDIMRKKLKETEELNNRHETNRRELIANISHDLKTPITSIKGYVNGIQDGIANTPEKMDRYVKTITKKVHELDILIDELFLYSKLNLNKVTFYFERINVKEYLQDFVEDLRFDIEGKKTMVHFYPEESSNYLVEADREKLNRVMTNVIENSLKYMDKTRQHIEIILSSEEELVTIEVKDNGRGINEESLSYIFDQFYRTDASRNSSTGGSGIGLSIVKQIVENHGGKVWAESKEGSGTSVYFTLPKAGED